MILQRAEIIILVAAGGLRKPQEFIINFFCALRTDWVKWQAISSGGYQLKEWELVEEKIHFFIRFSYIMANVWKVARGRRKETVTLLWDPN